MIAAMSPEERQCVIPQFDKCFHVTVALLALHREDVQKSATQLLEKELVPQIRQILGEQELQLQVRGLNYFQDEKKLKPNKQIDDQNLDNLSLIYLEIDESELLLRIADLVIGTYIDRGLIDVEHLGDLYMRFDAQTGRFRPDNFHLSMFRVKKTVFINQRGEEEKCDFQKLFMQFGERDLGIFTASYIEIAQFYTPLTRQWIAQGVEPIVLTV